MPTTDSWRGQPYYTAEESAAILEVSVRSALRYIRDGTLAAVKIGGQWRVRESALDEFMQSGTSAPGLDAAFMLDGVIESLREQVAALAGQVAKLAGLVDELAGGAGERKQNSNS